MEVFKIMIKGLYEAHLPVSNMEVAIEFYESMGLELTDQGSDASFLWIEKGKSWLGLWKCNQVELPYHPSIRHLAFRIDFEDMKRVNDWLKAKGIKVRKDFGVEPDKAKKSSECSLSFFYIVTSQKAIKFKKA